MSGSSRQPIEILRTLIGESLFREDLYYRLNVVEIDVPGLAKRPEDIAELARSFLDRLTADNRKEPLELGGDALAVLQAYPWPGNVRQLRNVMEWIVIMAPQDSDRVVRPNMLPPGYHQRRPCRALRREAWPTLMSLPLRAAREAFERQYLDAQVLQISAVTSRGRRSLSAWSALPCTGNCGRWRKVKMMKPTKPRLKLQKPLRASPNTGTG